MDGDRWHPSSRAEYERIVGRDVYTHDGAFIGRVDRIVYPEAVELAERELGHYVVIQPDSLRSPLGANEVFVPEEAIALANKDAVELAVDASGLEEQDWARRPIVLDDSPPSASPAIPPAT